ncbi:MAG: PAS domain S-box protein [Deltaproteobacteria bacterium]|nr:PAS domain S-box protein [Deltaproteobacteria bacterium]
MDKNKRLYCDQVHRLLGQTVTGVSATLIAAIILSLALWNLSRDPKVILWLFSMAAVVLIRVFIRLYFLKTATTVENVIRRRNYVLISLAVTGGMWGLSGIILFPYSNIIRQVFLVFVLGGMVAGSVGLFATLKSAYYCFSIPTVLPVIINLSLIGDAVHYAMGAMLAIFWFIMTIAAMRLNIEIIETFNLKYENLELISDLEKEVRDRKAAEERLITRNQEIEAIVNERTSELMDVNKRLRNEIEERKEAEEALRNSEEKYRELADSLPQIVFEADGLANITFVNRNAYKLFGYNQDDLNKGLNLIRVIAPDEREKAEANISKRLNGTRSFGNEYIALRKDGSEFPISVHVNPVISNGRTIGLRGIAIDLTEAKKAEEEQKAVAARLQRAEKMETLGIMAGGVAHDLNNILSGIVTYPELLLIQIPDKSPLREPLTTILDAGRRAAALVQDLLTLTRRGVITENVVNLNDIIHEYINSPENERILSSHPDVKLEVDLENGLLNILGSRVHLIKTVMNLITNAAEALPGGGTIRLSTRNQYLDRPVKGYDDIACGDYAVLSVSDDGIGIPQSDLKRIFEPFFTKKVMGRRSGTGLGMSVVWGTIKDHKGYIDVESTEGRGTVFNLFFPVTREKQDLKMDSRPINIRQGKGESILVVDDARDQREIASAILAEIGYSVNTVSSGEEALSYIMKNSADLIVLDMIMDPGMDGLDTYRKILEIRPGQRAIIASGFSETDRVIEAQRLGAGAYVQKPYTIDKLGTAVMAELGEK